MPLSVGDRYQRDNHIAGHHQQSVSRGLVNATRAATCLLGTIAIIPLAGWIVGSRALTIWFFDRAPMRPGVAVLLLLIAMFGSPRGRRLPAWYRLGTAGIALILGTRGVLPTAHPLPLDSLLLGPVSWYDESQGPRDMPMLSAVLIATLGVALTLWAKTPRAAHLMLTAIAFVAYTSIIGQIFGAAEFYQIGGAATMPAMSAVGILLAALLLLAVLPPHGLARYLTVPGSAGMLVRPVMTVVPVAIPAVAGAAMGAHEAGMLDHATVAAVISASGLLVTTIVAWRAASRLSASDAIQAEAYARVDAANDDLTARIAVRTAELQHSTEMFSTAFESAPVGMVLRDTSGRITRANQALLHLTGLDTLVETPFVALLHPDDRSTVEAWKHAADETYEAEVRITTGPGQFRWVGLADTLLCDATGGSLQILGHITDIDEHKSREHRLTQLAGHDPLTGLLNRRGFESALEECLAAARHSGREAALVAVDLDNFKTVNDTCGHLCGDDLLVAVAAALRQSVRPGDAVARTGGDEFLVLLSGVTSATAADTTQRLIDAVRERAELLGHVGGVVVTASAGIAIFDESASGVEMIRRADRALYAAKEAGRNCWILDQPAVPVGDR